MTGACAWCGCDVPGKRRGRKGKRVFCCRGHKQAFLGLAIELGRELLGHAVAVNYPGGAAAFAKHWLSNFQGHSTVPAAPSETLAPFPTRLA